MLKRASAGTVSASWPTASTCSTRSRRHHHPGSTSMATSPRIRHPGGHRHQVPGRARRHRREVRPVQLLHHVPPSASPRAAGTRWSPRCSSSRTTTTRTSRCGRCCRVRAEEPALRARRPARSASRSTALCKQNDVARLTTEMYLSGHGAGDASGRRLRQDGAPRDRARAAFSTSSKVASRRVADALSAGYPLILASGSMPPSSATQSSPASSTSTVSSKREDG